MRKVVTANIAKSIQNCGLRPVSCSTQHSALYAAGNHSLSKARSRLLSVSGLASNSIPVILS
jgi:hypothetical protein